MALELDVEYPSNTTPGDANYPYGSAKNESTPGAEDGLPGEKEWFNDWLGFFQGLLVRAGIIPSGNADTVLTSDYLDALDVIIPAQVAAKNAVIDGGMMVGTGLSASISGSYQYGECPLIAAKADGTPTNGDIEQAETALLGGTGFACVLVDITTGGGGAVYYRYRIESKDARRFVSQAALIHCKVYHDVGSAIDYTVTANKADAEDDFSSVTNIDTSGSLSVDSAAETQISFAISNMGACGNGIEIEISAACGAVTTKDFYLTELTLQLGAVISPFEYKPMAEVDIEVSRYYERLSKFGATASQYPFGVGVCQDSSNAELMVTFRPKRTPPTWTYSSPLSDFAVYAGGTPGVVNNLTLGGGLTFIDRMDFYAGISTTVLTSGFGAILRGISGQDPYFEFDARL